MYEIFFIHKVYRFPPDVVAACGLVELTTNGLRNVGAGCNPSVGESLV